MKVIKRDFVRQVRDGKAVRDNQGLEQLGRYTGKDSAREIRVLHPGLH
jgi:hypothetical protein